MAAGPTARQWIERYGPGGFVVSGRVFTGAVLILPGESQDWDGGTPDHLKPGSLQPVVAAGTVELLLLGTGAQMRPVPPDLRALMKSAGIVIDAMATAAACRTYGVLRAEERQVAAALFPLLA